jgi:DNA-binding PadR family transcriptional regulator
MKYSVLGFLIDQPMHGYALKRALSPALPAQQQVNDGILYPLLKRLESEGLVRKRVEPGRGSRDRHVFHPTAKGRRAFERWLAGTDDESDEVTYDFLLGHPFLTKCLFFSSLTPAQMRTKLEDQLVHCSEKLETFESIRSRMVDRDVDAYRIAVLDLGIAQQKEKERWLKRMIREAGERPAAKTAA